MTLNKIFWVRNVRPNFQLSFPFFVWLYILYWRIKINASNVFFRLPDSTLSQELFRCNLRSDRIYVSV